MKSLILASPRGFCAGVVRAIKAVELTLERINPPVYVKHDIVHNAHVVRRLAEKGAVFVEDISSIPSGSTVIFSAHGVSKKVMMESKKRDLKIIDATCPLVTKTHKEVTDYTRQGLHTILIGHKGHVEVQGTLGQTDSRSISLVQNEEEAASFSPPAPELAYVTQTTLSVSDTNKIIKILKSRFPTIKGPKKEDICYATSNRQEAVQKIAREVQVGLVLGAPHSSNSMRLKETFVQAGCPRAFLMEDKSQAPWETIDSHNSIGLTASASAPEYLVQDLIQEFRHRYQDVKVKEILGREEKIAFSLPQELRDGHEKS